VPLSFERRRAALGWVVRTSSVGAQTPATTKGGVTNDNWTTVRSNDLPASLLPSPLSLIRSSSGRWRRLAEHSRTNRVTSTRQGGDNRRNDVRRDNRITPDAAAAATVGGCTNVDPLSAAVPFIRSAAGFESQYCCSCRQICHEGGLLVSRVDRAKIYNVIIHFYSPEKQQQHTKTAWPIIHTRVLRIFSSVRI